MWRTTIEQWKHIPEDTEVGTGYAENTVRSPKERGLYTLYEVVDDSNCHAGWQWERE